MILERVFYAVLRLIRFLCIFLLIGKAVVWGWHWVGYTAAILGFVMAVFYHRTEDPHGYFKGRIATDVGLAGLLTFPNILASTLKPIHPDLVPAFTVGVIVAAIAVWLWFYRYERQSIGFAARINAWPVLTSKKFWGWVGMIAFFYAVYLAVMDSLRG